MDRHASPFQRSWLPTVKMVAAGAVVAGIGVPVLVAGYSGMNLLLLILGGCATLAGPSMVLAAPFMGRGGYGACPVCGTGIEALPGSTQNLLCGGCGAYLDVEGETLTTITAHRVHDTPMFAVPTPWPDIRGVISSTVSLSASDYVSDAVSDAIMKDKGVRVMDARWPDGCCVCSAPVDRREIYALKVRMAGNIRDSHAELVVPDVPYCTRHKDGIDFDSVSFDSKGHDRQFAMRFRSLDYRDAFRTLNPWRWEGMVPSKVAARASHPAAATADAKVVIQCPRCHQQHRVPTGRRGSIRCRGCGELFDTAT